MTTSLTSHSSLDGNDMPPQSTSIIHRFETSVWLKPDTISNRTQSSSSDTSTSLSTPDYIPYCRVNPKDWSRIERVGGSSGVIMWSDLGTDMITECMTMNKRGTQSSQSNKISFT
jgi:hypothetical protein